MPKPLEGIKILDLSRILAGPYATMLLRELGAEIIKVERPGSGDDARYYGPFKNEQSVYFISINRGKKSITINLKSPEGIKIIKEMVTEFDVLIENFRPGTMERLGIGYDVLKKINPRLIYAATSGFGHTGPKSHKPAYDMLVQAMGGMMSITGWKDMPPTRVGMSIGDIGTALFTSIGINAALYQREKTGLGQKVDIAMLDCQIALLENALVRYQVDGKPPIPHGNHHPTITPFQAFKAKDEYFVLALGNDTLWKKFCDVMNRNDLLNDPKFISNDERTKNREIIIPIMEKLFVDKTASEWIEFFTEKGIPSGPINSMDKVIDNKQLQSRNMFVEVNDEKAGKIKIAGNPIKMSTIPEEKTRQTSPKIGEHTNEILGKYLGFDEEKIKQLKEDGVI
ncbi:MAG: CaiB/BaiF CoA-transferase family protein [Candidatus Cloacimonadota bacterium]|nr:CaiB/BaiF CoA-transferase family protein [Candidatus Cloacimonadota bacterium]